MNHQASIENMVKSPNDFFSHPQQVVRSEELNQDQKLKILQSWKEMCQHLQESTGEGMDRDEPESDSRPDELQAVSNAIYGLTH